MTKKEIWDLGACKPDYEFWRRAAYWTIEEAVALSLDKDPRRFNTESLKSAPKDAPVVKEYFEWMDLANRAVSVSRLSERPLPEEFLEWRLALGLDALQGVEMFSSDFPTFLLEQDAGNPLSVIDFEASYRNLEESYRGLQERLSDALDEIEILENLSDASTSFNVQASKRTTLDQRQKKTYLKVLLSLAIVKYRFNPSASKSSVPANMESATAQCGLVVTSETIRNHLKEAVACFPHVLDLFEDD